MARQSRSARARRSSEWLSTLCILVFLIATGCRSRPCPAPVVIPLPSPPSLPSVTVPHPDPSGRYCMTEEEMLRLMNGVKALKTYCRQLEESIKLSNAASTPPR